VKRVQCVVAWLSFVSSRSLFGSAAILVFSSWLSAQSIQALPSAIHVFPQVVDGFLFDTSFYRSAVWMTNNNDVSVSCIFTGTTDARRFFVPATVLLGPRSITVATTPTLPVPITQQLWLDLASGVLQINCTGPIVASLTYQSFKPDAEVQGEATVFSARPITFAVFNYSSALNAAGRLGSNRFAIAIANTNNFSLAVDVSIGVGSSPKTITLTIGPQSQYVGFVDQIIGGPVEFSGSADQAVVLRAAAPFYLTVLHYAGATFTTIIPWGQ
jgi:hypothetical protein